MEADEQLRGDRTRRGERVWSGIRHGKDHLRLLPPSANWYCAKICDWGRSDDVGLLLAFGAKNSVFIYQVAGGGGGGEDSSSGGDAVKLSFFAQLVRGKRDRRVTAVQFLTDTTGELRLVCGGEEGSVQIWDVATLTMIEQHRKHKAEVMAVTVSGLLDANFVVAGDRQGRISAWERDAGKVSVFMPISGDGIHSMAVSPHDKTLIAVGYRSGVLCLVDAAQGTVRYRLAGHDQEVQCVAWKATDKSNHSVAEDEEGAESGSAERDVWLASSSRDKTIKLWKLASDSAEEPVLEQLLRLPTGKQVLATAVLTAKNSSTEDVAQSLESLVRSLLHLLRVSFLGQELCEGLKDAENQSQLQTLLNEMVVASQLLPDGPSTSQVQNVDSSAGEVEQDDESKKCVSRKQALINDTDDLRSCLTWSEDGVK
ncbi:Gem-associated protein 5 [Phytophthora cinnamomi]|uniref:Gem-associated protein 5 n=1 Tax=Phytophthora cinnamomi TaxID=4785 RepID=UPI00355A1361|nr:Gem-associated protein 5 [Phytophthora cinnamomi]